MVNNSVDEISGTSPAGLRAASWVLGGYGAIATGTIIALVVMSSAAPHLATREAWGHAVIVAVLSFILPLRLRGASRGSTRALVAVAVIAAALSAANVVEAALPGVFPGWMRVEMIVIAALMAALATLAVRSLRQARR
jgi:hypothetical protein